MSGVNKCHKVMLKSMIKKKKKKNRIREKNALLKLETQNLTRDRCRTNQS